MGDGGDRVSPIPSSPLGFASQVYTIWAKVARGIEVGRGKSVWSREEARKGWGRHGSGCQEREDFCMQMRTGRDFQRDGRGLESWGGQMSERTEVQLEVAVGGFKGLSCTLPSPRLLFFQLPLLILLGSCTPTLRILRMQTLHPHPPSPAARLCESPSLDKSQTLVFLLVLGVGKGGWWWSTPWAAGKEHCGAASGAQRGVSWCSCTAADPDISFSSASSRASARQHRFMFYQETAAIAIY